jgi:hypothetical protein
MTNVQRYRTDPEFRQKTLERVRAYRKANREKCLARNRQWCERNPERRREIARLSYHRCKARALAENPTL